MKIKQTENSGSYEYSILIDDKQLLSKENTTPKVWNNVQAEFGRIKDVSGFRIAKGSYRNLQVTSKCLILQTYLCNLIQWSMLSPELLSLPPMKHIKSLFCVHPLNEFSPPSPLYFWSSNAVKQNKHVNAAHVNVENADAKHAHANAAHVNDVFEYASHQTQRKRSRVRASTAVHMHEHSMCTHTL